MRFVYFILAASIAASGVEAFAQGDVPFAQRSLLPERGIRSHPDPVPAERYRNKYKPAAETRPAAAPYQRAAPVPPEPEGALTGSLISVRQGTAADPDPESGRTSNVLDLPPYSQPTPGEEGVPLSEQTLFAPWIHGGEAISGEYLYACDTFCVARGGSQTRGAIKYIGNLDLIFNFDTEKLGAWEGGRFFLYLESVHGQTLSPHYVKDFEFYDEYEPFPRLGPVTQVTEYWLEQKVGDKLTFKIGKQDANRDFIYPEYGVDYINSSFSLIPTILPPTYPNCGLGLAAFYQASDLLMLRAGVYDGSFFVGQNSGGQWGFSTLGEFGAMSLFEAQLRPLWREGRLPGNYRFGGWYHTGNFQESAAAPGVTLKTNHGLYVSIDQMLYRENPADEDDLQGLGLFAQYGYAPYDRNTLEDYVGGGLAYRGLLPRRDEDICGVGVGQCFFSRSLAAAEGKTTETSIEVFYKIHVKHWLRLQPEMQFIAKPDGNGRDALVVGLRAEIAL